ncbi:MAG: acetate--CoA ligase family protein, partial [Candidatus Hodarchaeota archaeon]
MSTLEKLFGPRSIAVIGASDAEGKVGYAVLSNLKDFAEAGGKVYPINPNKETLQGYRAYKSILDIPEEIDMAVFCIPARFIMTIIKECAEKKVQAVICITAGFKEIGPEGARLEREMIDFAREHNIRVVGPNVLGIMSTGNPPINATFAADFPKKGIFAFMSQSGAMLIGILDWAQKRAVGFSKIISIGNKGDLDETDFISYLADDPDTKVILAYLEDIKRGPEFLRTVRKIQKPVLVLKSGFSSAGARAASSHTGSLAGNRTAYEVAFERAGVLLVDGVGELFQLAKAFQQPPLRGPNIAVLSNAGGLVITSSDAIEKYGYGLRTEPLLTETIKRLEAAFPREAAVTNPIDILGTAKGEDFRKALEILSLDESVGGILVAFCMAATTQPMITAQAIVDTAKKTNIPLFAALVGGPMLEEAATFLESEGIPVFDFPDPAAKALGGMYRFQELQKRKRISEQSFIEFDQELVQAVLANARKDKRVVLLGSEAIQLARAFGIPAPPTKLATNPEHAVQIAEEFGYPVVLKIASPDLIHKTDFGGVELNLSTKDQVKDAYNRIITGAQAYLPDARIYGCDVQKQAGKPVAELFVGMMRDPVFGSMIAFGLGGIFVEVLKDVSFALAPLSLHDARKLVTSIKAYSIIRGVRGQPPVDSTALEETLLRVSALVTTLNVV